MPEHSSSLSYQDDNLKAELAFQAKRASKIVEVYSTPLHIVRKYQQCRFWRLYSREFLFKHLKDIDGKEVLDFGCGDGALSTLIAKLGARVTGIDVSPELLEIAHKRADLDGVHDRTLYILGDITDSTLPKNSFDVVVCNLVLHHVDLHSVFPLILAALRPGGRAIILEPIAFSPFLQRIRDIIPIDKRASPGERQLREDDVKFILEQMDVGRITYFNLFGRLRRLLPNRDKSGRGYPITSTALFVLYGLDRFLLTLCPALSKYCGNVAIVGYKR